MIYLQSGEYEETLFAFFLQTLNKSFLAGLSFKLKRYIANDKYLVDQQMSVVFKPVLCG